jgi:hypothetical protein
MLLDLYRAFSFACVPTGIDVAVILHMHLFYAFSLLTSYI